MDCPKCGTEMEEKGSFLSHYSDDLIILFQCPLCKEVKLE